jgi:hypothetical protein
MSSYQSALKIISGAWLGLRTFLGAPWLRNPRIANALAVTDGPSKTWDYTLS